MRSGEVGEMLAAGFGRREGRPAGRCLSDQEIAAIASGASGGPAAEHLAACDACFEALVATMDALEARQTQSVVITATAAGVLHIVGPGYELAERVPEVVTRGTPQLRPAVAEARRPYGARRPAHTVATPVGNVGLLCDFARAPSGLRVGMTATRMPRRASRVLLVARLEHGGVLASGRLRRGDRLSWDLPEDARVIVETLCVGSDA
jgi:hypothetical protein